MLKTYRVFSVCFLLSAYAFLTSADAYGQSAVLKELAQEDQAAQRGKKVARTDEERIKIVLGLIAQGALQVPEDRFNAALVLQHTPLTFCGERLVSTSPDNYLLAHHLFASAFDAGHKEARYLVAASIDRYLSFTEGFQKYGTNRVTNQKTGKEELVPIDRNTPDSERAKYGVPPLAELLKTFPEQTAKKARQKKASATGSPFRMRVFPRPLGWWATLDSPRRVPLRRRAPYDRAASSSRAVL